MRIPSAIAMRVTIAAAVAFSASTAVAGEVHEVTQKDFIFVPETITVTAGDTVRWQWTSKIHTVTSGTDCTHDGKFFDEDLTAAQPVVEYVVPEDFSGQIPYFCDPHCLFGMTGLIIVEPATSGCPEDLDGSGDVGFTDLLSVLTSWGPCAGCPEDLDESGDVGFTDLLAVLTAWGPCP